MRKQATREDSLVEKLRRLPPDKVAEVEDFIDFLARRDDRRLTRAASRLSEKACHKVWDNPHDAAYDHL